MKRLSKEDWLQEGFEILSEFAQDKIRIVYLCERLGVTRGSFYHHFKSIGDYINSLLKAWEMINTVSLIEASEEGRSPQEKMTILNDLVFQSNNAMEAAIRSWAFYNESVKTHLEKVDTIRLDYLKQIFVEFGVEEKKAALVARLEYITLIGVQQMYPEGFGQEVYDLYQLHTEMLKQVLK